MAERLLNIKFVSEVKKHPCLYNYKLKEYSRKDITEKTWVTVGKAVNLTALQAKERWKNLRSVFVRNLKPRPSGSLKKKKYYLADAMQFAIPYIKIAATSSGSLFGPEEQGNETEEDNQNASPEPISPSPTFLIDHTERSSTPLSILSQRSSYGAYRRTNKNNLSDSDELFNEHTKTKMSKSNMDELSTINNANKMFLLSLLPDLNSMVPTQLRSFKRQAIDLIDNILNGPCHSSTLANQSIAPLIAVERGKAKINT